MNGMPSEWQAWVLHIGIGIGVAAQLYQRWQDAREAAKKRSEMAASQKVLEESNESQHKKLDGINDAVNGRLTAALEKIDDLTKQVAALKEQLLTHVNE